MGTNKTSISIEETREFIEFLKTLDKTEKIAVWDILNGVKVLTENIN